MGHEYRYGMSHTPSTGQMRSAMKDAVKRTKGNKKQAAEAKDRFKMQATQRRAKLSYLMLAVVGPLSLLLILYPLHTMGILRIWGPSALSRALDNPSQAKKLDLTEQFLKEVPESVGELENLQTLILDANKLTSLGEPVTKLKKLTYLSLSHNQLTEVPPEIGSLKSLRELHLSGNQLTSLPKELFKLPNLEVLVIKSNSLTGLPEELGQLSNLKILDIKFNKIGDLPKSISSLKKLEKLLITGNKMSRVPDLKGLSNLKNVSLKDTGLSATEVDLLKQQLGREVTVNQ